MDSPERSLCIVLSDIRWMGLERIFLFVSLAEVVSDPPRREPCVEHTFLAAIIYPCYYTYLSCSRMMYSFCSRYLHPLRNLPGPLCPALSAFIAKLEPWSSRRSCASHCSGSTSWSCDGFLVIVHELPLIRSYVRMAPVATRYARRGKGFFADI